MLKQFVKIFSLSLIGILFLYMESCKKTHQKLETKTEEKVQPTFSTEVEQIIQRKINKITELVQNPLVIEAVRSSNVGHQKITQDEILALDQKWRTTKGIDEFIRGFIINPCAKYLIQFQENNEEFPEIFIADTKGLNVCQTNKTTDYYQADEEWWIQGFNEGKGKTYHGEIEYDESAQSEAIAVYVPIMDPDLHKAIGVCKAIVDITSIKADL